MKASVGRMSFIEIQPQIEQLPHEERVKALAFLKHLLRAENPDYRRELAQRHADIEAGRGRTCERDRVIGLTLQRTNSVGPINIVGQKTNNELRLSHRSQRRSTK